DVSSCAEHAAKINEAGSINDAVTSAFMSLFSWVIWTLRWGGLLVRVRRRSLSGGSSKETLWWAALSRRFCAWTLRNHTTHCQSLQREYSFVPTEPFIQKRSEVHGSYHSRSL